MSGGYVYQPTDPFERLTLELATLKDQVRELQRPTGTQIAEAVAGAVDFGSIGLSATAFTLPTAYGTPIASGAMDIPEGMTRAAVLGVVSIGAWNGSISTDYIYARCSINGSPGGEMIEAAGPSSYRAVTVSAIRTISGLTPGGTLPVAIEARAADGWGSHSSNIAHIDVIALFRR